MLIIPLRSYRATLVPPGPGYEQISPRHVPLPFTRALQPVNLANDAGIHVVQISIHPQPRAVAGFAMERYAPGFTGVGISGNVVVHQPRVASRAVATDMAREA